jgi:hypothetical protein
MSDREKPREPKAYVGVTEGTGRGEPRLLAGVVLGGRSPAAMGRLMVGVVLVLFGVLWTLDNLGLSLAGQLLHWWPVLLVVYGVIRLTGTGMPRSPLQGAFFAGVGMLLVIARIAHLPVGLGVFFPLLTIFAGVSFVRRALRGEEWMAGTESSEENIQLTAVMGAAKSRNVGTAVRRGELCAVMGGIELDLREAQPASDRLAIEACAIMGGIEIVVPDTWRVESDIMPIVGGFEDRTQRSGAEAPACTLVLSGIAAMGGVVVRNTPSEGREVRIVRRRRVRDGDDVHEVRVSTGGVHVRREGEDIDVGPGGVSVRRNPPPATPPITAVPPPVDPQ